MRRPAGIPLKASRVMIGLGLLLALAAAAAALVDAQRAASPFDQLDDLAQSTQGFTAIIVPQASRGQLPGAPTLPSPITPSAGQPSPAPTRVVLAASATREHVPAADEGPPPSASPAPVWIPDRLVIPAIELEAPVEASALKEIMSWGQLYQQWVAPNRRASGWHTTSASLGVPGNTVLNGHHNLHGEVFAHLVDLKEGDLLWVYSGARAFVYRVALITTLPERWQTLDVRLENARWIQPSQDERLTLVTCWPYASNTHRLILVAMPVNLAAMEDYALVPRLTPPPAAP